MPKERLDWQEVVRLDPKGYLELNNGKMAIHGPVESVEVGEDDMVVIKLKWAAQSSLSDAGLPSGDWKAIIRNRIFFPNMEVPFIIEDTPEKGRRVRFGSTNILYLDEVEGLDPKKVQGINLAAD